MQIWGVDQGSRGGGDPSGSAACIQTQDAGLQSGGVAGGGAFKRTTDSNGKKCAIPGAEDKTPETVG